MNSIKIDGNYSIHLQYTRMFQQYNIPLLKGHNIITDDGIQFFMERIIGSTTDTIYEILLGTSTINPSSNNTTKSMNIQEYVSPGLGIDGKQITLQSTLTIQDMENITEIGVRTSGASGTGEDGILISRDTFDAIDTDLNIDALFIIKYTYTFTIDSTTINWYCIKDKPNTYCTGYNKTIQNITEDDGIMYTEVETIEDVETTKTSYYYDSENNLLYLHTSDGLNPLQHTVYLN